MHATVYKEKGQARIVREEGRGAGGGCEGTPQVKKYAFAELTPI